MAENRFGKNLEYYRNLKGLSLEELGKKIGVKRQTIYKYEKGIVTNIPVQKIEKISHVLGISPIQLFFEENPNEEALKTKELRLIVTARGVQIIDELEEASLVHIMNN